MKLSLLAIIVSSLVLTVGHAEDEKLPAGVVSATHYTIKVNRMSDEVLTYLDKPEFTEREELYLSFAKGTTDADLARLKYVPWVKNIAFESLDFPIDVKRLGYCQGLRAVSFRSNEIKNLELLKAFPKLESVKLLTMEGMTDLEALRGLKQIRHLTLHAMDQITDYSPLAGLVNLETLDLTGHDKATVESLAPIGKLVNLHTLQYAYYPAADLSPFATCTKLKDVNLLFAKSLEDIRATANWREIQTLNLAYSKVSDLSPLAGAATLEKLDVRGSQVAVLSPLGNLPKLKTLELHQCPVEDIRPLATMPALYSLNLTGTKVTDISALSSVKTLRYLDVAKGTAADQIDAVQTALPEARIQ